MKKLSLKLWQIIRWRALVWLADGRAVILNTDIGLANVEITGNWSVVAYNSVTIQQPLTRHTDFMQTGEPQNEQS